VAIWFSRYVLAGELSNSMDAGVCMAVLEDRRGRVLDNLFIERLWGSVKYEDVYLRDYPDGLAAQEGLGRCFRFYNCERPHQGLEEKTLAAV